MTKTRPLNSLEALERDGLISADQVETLTPVTAHYALAVTAHVSRLIDRTDPADPVARMFVPSLDELTVLPEELNDPIGDKAHTPVEGIVHRYPNRVLLKPVAVCPVYCRFCFRREMVGPELGEALSPAALEAALDYVRQTPAVKEVILTGGDPFMLSARRAEALTASLSDIPHVDIIRWHTRMPVADPSRITSQFVSALKSASKAVYVSLHINHVREFSEETKAAVRRMVNAGIALISQSVLLKGVNDTPDALAELMSALIAERVQPYYLHHPDLAPGTSHFRVSIEDGQALYQALCDRVSGLAVPRYVLDIPGGVSKANAAKSDISSSNEGIVIRGRDNRLYRY